MQLIAGVDEVGRGPLAGDVVAAAVILDPSQPIIGLTDSKKLSPKKRLALSEKIRSDSLTWCIGRASVAEIDDINILQASLLAMKRAVLGLSQKPDLLRIDGNQCPDLPYTMEAIIKGDALFPEIGAASIIAKVTRDKEMEAFDNIYPEYGFAGHKGYPTKKHREALLEYGVTPIHRRSYAPVRKIIENQ